VLYFNILYVIFKPEIKPENKMRSKKTQSISFEECLNYHQATTVSNLTKAFLQSPLVRLVESKFRSRDHNLTIRLRNTEKLKL